MYSMDYSAYYPYLIAGFNLSHETVAIHTAGFIVELWRTDKTFRKNLAQAKMMRFCAHRGGGLGGGDGGGGGETTLLHDDDLENLVNSRRYINGQLDNASNIDVEQLFCLPTEEKIMIILNKVQRTGVLAKIIQIQNEEQHVKKTKKL